MQKPPLPKIRAAAAERGDFMKSIPEFYQLREVVEVNGWHDHDSVFSHTLNVLGKLESLIRRYESKVGPHLDAKVGNYSRMDLLFTAALLHDIAKKECFTSLPDGTTECPGHEGFGATKAKNILGRFDLDDGEKDFVADLVKNHGFFDDIAAPGNPSAEKDLKVFQYDHPGMLIEMTLLSYADTVGNQLGENDPDECLSRVDFYKGILDRLE